MWAYEKEDWEYWRKLWWDWSPIRKGCIFVKKLRNEITGNNEK